jgi:hypothetical protein
MTSERVSTLTEKINMASLNRTIIILRCPETEDGVKECRMCYPLLPMLRLN